MTLGDRIQERLQALGWSQSELARQTSLPQTTINGLVRRGHRSTPHLHRIATALGTTSGYLAGDHDDPEAGATPPVTPQVIADQLDLVPIAEIDLAYGMGGTFADGPVEQEVRHFPRSFIEAITTSPPIALTLARGQGDSMEPTIRDRELVIIDRSERSVRSQDLVWALTVGDIGMIKRLRVRGRQVFILSDNPSVSDDVADADEVNIVGRVIFVGRRL